MADYREVTITHCCRFGCLANADGVRNSCYNCGGTDINYHTLYRCGICGRDHEWDANAEVCCDPQVQVVVVMTEDGSLSVADYVDNIPNDPQVFFAQALENIGKWRMGTIWLPSSIAELVVLQGTLQQDYADGDAATAACNDAAPDQMNDPDLWTTNIEEE